MKQHLIYGIFASIFTSVYVSPLVFSQARQLPVDTAVITSHSIVINQKTLPYTAEVGMQPVWDDAGMPIAALHYTFYEAKSRNDAPRPLLMSFNGGPGSASVWMHMAYTGPKALAIDDEGFPIQPYGYQDNPHSVLEVADIVYVNPVNTGYSRPVPQDGKGVDMSTFFGVNADIKYLAKWLSTFVSRHGLWRSPKYLIGESYGGTRVAGLAHALQKEQWMYLNGVVLVSPADYRAIGAEPAMSSALNLPYFTATAWYHKMLPPALQKQDLLDILPLAENYAMDTLLPAVAKGNNLPQKDQHAVAQRLAYYSGLPAKAFEQHQLNVPNTYFWKALLRDKNGYTVGRLDSRYLGLDRQDPGIVPDYNSELTSWLHAFTPAINHYIRESLGFATDLQYNMFGPVKPWDFSENNTREELRMAMAQNPFLNVMVQSGYYDGATTYFQAKYTLSQLDPSGRMKDRLSFKGYRSGHMMYLRREDLKKANQDLREFIQKTMVKTPAKYK